MRYEEIEAFLAIYEYGSIRAAAERLFVNQATMSERIQTLENELGITLFDRSRGKRNTKISEGGKRFLPIAEKWKRLWEETKTLSTHSRGTSFRIAAGHSISAYVIPEICAALQAELPDCAIEIRSRHPQEIYSVLEMQDTDIGLVATTRFSQRVRSRALYRERSVIISNPLSGFSKLVSPTELDPSKEIAVILNTQLNEWRSYWFHEDQHSAVRTDDVSFIGQLTSLGDYWSIVPITVASFLRQRNHVYISELSDGPRERTVYLLDTPTDSESPVLGSFLRHSRDIMTSRGAEWLLLT